MLIFLAISVHIIGHLLICWAFGINYSVFRSLLSFKRLMIELGGIFANFIVAFIIIIFLGFVTYDSFLANKDAIYGIRCNHLAKEFGFKDGDKILSINGEEIERFNDLEKEIVMSVPNASIDIGRGDSLLNISISEKQIQQMITNKSNNLFSPLLQSDSLHSFENYPLKLTETRKGLKRSIEIYIDYFSMCKKLFFSLFHKANSVGGYRVISPSYSVFGVKFVSLETFLYLLSSVSILIGLLNLLPLPGFDVGNFIIALVEKIRKKTFDNKKMRIIRISGIACFVLFILIITYLI
jgi:membrane-associated protease RseP (regulator of RpoE activity)